MVGKGCLYIMEYYSTTMESEFLSFEAKWMESEDTVTDTERPGLCILSRIWKLNEEAPCKCTTVNTTPHQKKK